MEEINERKRQYKNVIIDAINENAEALEKLRQDSLISGTEHDRYWCYLMGHRVALFECYYFIVEGIKK